MHVLESQKKLSQSMLWSLQRRFFEQTGPAAWSRGIVPHYITSNPFIASAYARVVFAFIQDCCEAGIDARQPLYILEIASGSGRFAFAFLRELFRLLDRSPLREVRVTYVMSDLAERNVEAWRAHPQLTPFVERGALDFARFDGERDQDIQLLGSGQRLQPGTLKNPLAVIANYYFDGIPQDSFRVIDGKLQENRVSVLSEQAEDPANPALLERVRLEYQAADAQPYEDEDFNGILSRYESRLGNTDFSFPICGLRCCRFLRRLAGDRLLLLSADKGISDEAALLGGSPPGFAFHGSFSMTVNYHAIGEYFRAAKGEMLFPDHDSHDLRVVACLLGRSPYEATRAAYADAVQFGPDDFFLVKKAAELHFQDFTVAQILGLLRLARHDARIFEQCLPTLFAKAAQSSARERRELVRSVERVWAGWFSIGEETDLACEIGLLLDEMGLIADALDYFQRSLARNPSGVPARLHTARCHFRMRQLDAAWKETRSVLHQEPTNAAARALRLELERVAPPPPEVPVMQLRVA